MPARFRVTRFTLPQSTPIGSPQISLSSGSPRNYFYYFWFSYSIFYCKISWFSALYNSALTCVRGWTFLRAPDRSGLRNGAFSSTILIVWLVLTRRNAASGYEKGQPRVELTSRISSVENKAKGMGGTTLCIVD